MVYVIINTLLYLCTFITVYRYKRHFDEGCFLLGVYFVTAVFNHLYYLDHASYYNHITLFPFIYLFIILLLFFRPYLTNRKEIADKIKPIGPNSKQYKILYFLCILYIVCSIISVYYSFSQFAENVAKEAWGEIYGNEDKFKDPYVNFVDGGAKRYTDYMRPVVLLFSFYMLSYYYEKNKLKVLVIISSVIVSTMIAAAAVASRGNIINVCILITLCYLLFRNKIPKKFKKYIYLFFGLFVALFAVYFISVTVARFGDGDKSTDSLLFYAGHSMLTFNDGIYYQTPQHSYGGYFFRYFVELFGVTPIQGLIGAKAEGLFFTFVGSLFIDFPPFLLFLIAILFPIWIVRMCHLNKRSTDFADLYLYVFYLNKLVTGFTVGNPYDGFLWAVAFLIYFSLKFLFKLRFD